MSDLLLDYYNALQQATNLQSKLDRIGTAVGPRDDLSEVCWCGDCEEKAEQNAATYCCALCGYKGKPAIMGCQCYDENSCGIAAPTPGSGCPHGSLTCPVCEDGEGSWSAWDAIKAIRIILAEGAP